MNTDKTENQTIEKSDNELIAEFMGHTFMAKYSDRERLAFREPFGKSWGHEAFNYGKRWDYLMPAVQKIRALFQDNSLFKKGKEKWILITLCLETTEIESVYLAVVQFISWYNSQKVKTDTEV